MASTSETPERCKLHTLVDSFAKVFEREANTGLTFDEIVDKYRLNLRDPYYIYFLSIKRR